MSIIGYLRRPEVRHHPFLLIPRRVAYEVTRHLRPDLLDRERVVRIRDGLRMSLRPSDHFDHALYLYGIGEFASATAFTSLIRRGMTVVDVGAHIGQYSLMGAKRVGPSGRVIAVEPQEPLRWRLELNLRLNQVSNVRVLGCALYNFDGEVWLHPPAKALHNSGLAYVSTTPSTTAAVVRCTTLDSIAQDLMPFGLDVLKVDVEGAERAVLEGGASLLERSRPFILFEVNQLRLEQGRWSAPAIDLLRDFGYDILGIRVTPHDGSCHLIKILPGADPEPYRERHCALNLVAVHPERPLPTSPWARAGEREVKSTSGPDTGGRRYP